VSLVLTGIFIFFILTGFDRIPNVLLQFQASIKACYIVLPSLLWVDSNEGAQGFFAADSTAN
jgi:hypothetical protein